MKKLLLYMLLPLLLFSYNDNDLDGVEDENDLCPNTSLVELVDSNGCTIETLTPPVKVSASYDIIAGVGYSKSKNNKTQTKTLQIDYFYKKFSLQLQSSYFSIKSKSSKQKALSDTYLGAYYHIDFTKKLGINFGARLSLPTYHSKLNNNNLDYTLSSSFNYKINKLNLLGGVGYSIIRDDNINGKLYKVNYQNSLNYHIGIGYFFTPRFYSNLSYLHSQSIYTMNEEINSLSFYGYYSLNNHWFSTISFSKRLKNEANDCSSSLRLGYYF